MHTYAYVDIAASVFSGSVSVDLVLSFLSVLYKRYPVSFAGSSVVSLVFSTLFKWFAIHTVVSYFGIWLVVTRV